MKKCSKCKKTKTVHVFSKDKSKKDGIASYCKLCAKKYYLKNKNVRLKKLKLWRKSNKDKVLVQKRKYYQKHKVRLRKEAKAKYKIDKIRILDKNKKWRKESVKGQFRDIKRGAEKRNLEFKITLDQAAGFKNKKCNYCGKAVKRISLDRVNNNRGYVIDNIVTCCEKCNRMKRNMTVNEFINQCKKIIQYSRKSF